MKQHPFEYQKPTDESVEKIKVFRDSFKKLHDSLQELPDSREKSVTITNLETSSMWVNKAIVFNQD